MSTSTIEWTEVTWNPTTGCDRVSAGCDRCYALPMAKRLKAMEDGRIDLELLPLSQAKYQTDGDPRTSGPGFGIAMHESTLAAPFGWKKPRKVFVNSMSDLFHDGVSDEFIAKVFVTMALTPEHTYQILTKRHARMRSLLASSGRWRDALDEAFRWACFLDLPLPGERFAAVREWLYGSGLRADPVQPLPNVWLGVSVENQQWADIRIPALLDTPAAVRFLSCEPLLGPVDLTAWTDPPLLCRESCQGQPTGERPSCSVACRQLAGTAGELGWVIVGGESGHGARPVHPDWVRALRDQCAHADVPFFFKQWGEWAPHDVARPTLSQLHTHGTHWDGTDSAMARVGKKAAGRELDGRTWDEFPEHVG